MDMENSIKILGEAVLAFHVVLLFFCGRNKVISLVMLCYLVDLCEFRPTCLSIGQEYHSASVQKALGLQGKSFEHR